MADQQPTTTGVRLIANGTDVATWQMTAVPREGEAIIGPESRVYMVDKVMWFPESAGGTAVIIMATLTGSRLPY